MRELPTRTSHLVHKPLVLLTLLAVAGIASGQEVLRTPIGRMPQGVPGLGAALRVTNVPYAGGGDTVDVVPLYLYEGDRVFADGTSAGFSLLQRDHFQFDLLGRYRFTQLGEDLANRLGVLERKQTVEGGVRAMGSGRWGELEGLWVSDLLDTHNGQQWEINYRHPIDLGRWAVTPWLSLQWQSSALASYYFGVSTAEAATSDFDPYTIGGVSNTSLGINSSYAITPNAYVFANVGTTNLDNAISSSPLVAEDGFVTAYVGGAYMFGAGVDLESGLPPERAGEWSWRVNGGYQAEGNIVGEISNGDFSASKDVSTYLAGVTASKLVRSGRRTDIYGRVAAFRHFEDGLQENFFSFSAYLMAFFKGFSSVTGREIFRFGFGYGLSYASRVPIVEQIKQARRDRDTNHLLNYLELSVDFPLKNFVRSRFTQRCYVGVTVVHRSGIFAISDVFGSVSGGSDWITGHLECKR